MASIVSAGTTSATALNMSADTSGVLQLASNNGTVAVTVDTSQNVGFNGTPSAWSSSKAIQLNGSTALWNFAGTNTYLSNNEYYNGTNRIFIANGWASEYQQAAGTHSWFVSTASGTAGGTVTMTQIMGLTTAGVLSVTNTGTNGSGAVNAITMNNPGTTVGDGPRLLFLSGTSTTGGCAIAGYGTSLNAADMVFYAGGNTERMRLGNDGRLNIAATGSFGNGGLFQVDATAQGGNYNGINIKGGTSSYAGVFYSTPGNFLYFTINGAGSNGTITWNGSNTVYATSSDQRLKENIVDAPSALNKINSVKIRSFNWIDSKIAVDFGVVAQELHEVAPEAIHVPLKEEDTWGADTSVLVPTMIKAIQELNAKVTALEEQVLNLGVK
jgi:hypothetical protein